MTYNLLDEPWIPVRRRSGKVSWIAPHQVAEREDPPVALACPRPDFDGGVLQFLIALLQTAAPPDNESAWRRWVDPPEPGSLKAAFDVHRAAFELLGDGSRFMQDPGLAGNDAEEKPITAILLGAPTGQTLEQNADVFTKRGVVSAIGLPAAAMSLVTLMANAPAGGAGYRTSLRGGGPLCTVLSGQTLWTTAWLNVLPRPVFERVGGRPALTQPRHTFPWLAELDGERELGPELIHPLQQFWAVPWRVRLGEVREEGVCDLAGTRGPVVRAVRLKNYGPNYKGAFLHPLTPYAEVKAGEPLNPRKLGSEGLPYRDWPAYVVGGNGRVPARVVQHFAEAERGEVIAGRQSAPARLLCFGYSLDKAKAESWSSSLAPLLVAAKETLPRVQAALQRATHGANEVRRTLQQQLRQALARRAEDLAFETTTFESISRRFWSETEPDFFKLADDLVLLSQADADEAALDARMEAWAVRLQEASLALFSASSQERGEFAATDVRRVSQAWHRLKRFTSPRNPVVRKHFGLPVIQQDAAAPRRRARA